MNLQKKLANLLATTKRKRHYYCEVEYLEATGTQYIDIGVGVKENTVFKGIFSIASTSTGRSYFGARNSSNERFQIVNSIGIGGGYFYNANIYPIANKKYEIEMHANGDMYLDGVKRNATNGTFSSVAFDRTLYIFNTNYYDGSGVQSASTFWKVQILEGDTLVRDMIPVLDWNMTPCMYDRVSGELFYNKGTGNFIAGRQIHRVGYLKLTGTQYIDTGIQPTDDYGYRIKNTYTVGGGEQCAIGCMDSGNRFVGVYTSGSSNAISGAWSDYVGFLPNYPWTTGTVLDVKCNYKNSRKIIIDETEMKDISDIHITGTISNSIYIGARNYGSNITKMRGNIYGIEITKGTEVIADYIPMVDENGVGAMFDRVTHTIYDNAGTGAFNYPPVQLEYLESTADEYIDTGIKFDCANTKIEVKTYEDSLTRIHSICGDDGNIFYYFRGTGNWAVGYNNTVANINSYMVVGDNIFVIDKNNVYLNGTLAKTYTASTTVSSYNALLFNRKTTRVDKGAVTMYYCKIWNNDVLVRNFIPCYKDGALGMWDKVNSVFYPNAGTGNFIAGKIKEK